MFDIVLNVLKSFKNNQPNDLKVCQRFLQARNLTFIKFCCSTRNIVRTYILSSMFLIIWSEGLCLLNGNLGLARQKLIILSRIFRSLIFRVYSYFFWYFSLTSLKVTRFYLIFLLKTPTYALTTFKKTIPFPLTSPSIVWSIIFNWNR